MNGLLVDVQRRLTHGLGHGGMAVDGFHELLDGALQLDGEGGLFDQLRGAGGQDMHAQDLAVLLARQDLDHAVRVSGHQAASAAAGGELADLIGDAQLLGPLLGVADACELRSDIGAGGAHLRLEDAVAAHGVLRRHLAHGHGRMGKHEFAGAVAHGVDAGDIGLLLLVGLDEAVLDRDARLVQAEVFGVGAAADGHQDLLGVQELLPVGALDLDLRALAGILHGNDGGGGEDLQTLAPELGLTKHGQLPVPRSLASQSMVSSPSIRGSTRGCISTTVTLEP